MTEDDGIAYLSFFVEEAEDGTLYGKWREKTEEEILSQVKKNWNPWWMFCEIGEGSIAVDETEDIDWINNWKKYFKQFYVDDILIIPSWEEVKEEDKDKMIIHIDPGTAFGTGMHETTAVYPPAEKIRDTGDRTSRCGNRKRYSVDHCTENGCKTRSRNRSGSMCGTGSGRK